MSEVSIDDFPIVSDVESEDSDEDTDVVDDRMQVLHFLTQSPYIRTLEKQTSDKLIPLMERSTKSLKRGEILFHANQRYKDGLGAAMYVVASGRLGLFNSATSKKPMVVYTKGQSLGEFGLLGSFEDDHCHSCQVTALEDTEIVFLSRDAYQNFAALYPDECVTFLRSSVASKWRVASFFLEHFLSIPLKSREAHQGPAYLASVQFPFTSHDDECSIHSLNQSDIEKHTDSDQPNGDGASDTESEPHTEVCLPLALLEIAKEVKLAPNEQLFHAGEPGSCVYVVKSGCLSAFASNGEYVAAIHPGSVVGGISFFGGTERGETVRCCEEKPSSVLQLSRKDFEKVLRKQPNYAIEIVHTVGRQFSPVLVEVFELGLQTEWFASGEILFDERDIADSFYVVISGRVRAVVKGGGGSSSGEFVKKQPVWAEPKTTTARGQIENSYSIAYEVGRGEIIGEVSLLNANSESVHATRRPFTALCVRDTRAVKISVEAFLHIVQSYPAVMMRFSQVLMGRLNQVHEEQRKKRVHGRARFGAQNTNITTIAIVPIGRLRRSTRDRVAKFSSDLTRHLKRTSNGSVYRLDQDKFDKNMGRGTSSKLDSFYHSERASQWFTQLEEQHRFILFEADAKNTVTPWSKCCVRHADCVLLVADADSNPTISQREQKLAWVPEAQRGQAALPAHEAFQSGRQKILVLLHKSNVALPKGTRHWLRPRGSPSTQLHSFHHIRFGDETHYGRLARNLAGKTVGVVLSGGGARGLAHLGVLRALEEANIPIDIIGGTSQGSFMAALYAKQEKAERMVAGTKNLCSIFTWGNIVYGVLSNLPWLLSYFDGEKFTEAIIDTFRDTQIEDLWIPYYCVTTNVTRCDIGIHQEGLLWKFVRASMSVLAYLPPVINDEGDLIIDGGYLNNLPVDVMFSVYDPHLIVAVDVEDKDISALQNVYNYGATIKGWKVAWLRYFRFEKMVHLREIFSWLTCINHSRQLRVVKDELTDIYIRPEVQGYDLMDYPKVEELKARGYTAGKEAITRWVDSNGPFGLSVSVNEDVSACTEDRKGDAQDGEERRITPMHRNMSKNLLRNMSTNALNLMDTASPQGMRKNMRRRASFVKSTSIQALKLP